MVDLSSAVERYKEKAKKQDKKNILSTKAVNIFGTDAMLIVAKMVQSGSSLGFIGAQKMLDKVLREGVDKFYTPWERDDGRVINSPDSALKKIQRGILVELYQYFGKDVSRVSGFGSSLVRIVEKHAPSKYQFSLDLKSAFDQINLRKVLKVFSRFITGKAEGTEDLKKEELKQLLGTLVTVDKDHSGERYIDPNVILHSYSLEPEVLKKRVLPQGAPTSSFIFELACKELDQELEKLARSLNYTISRYADDIQFSSFSSIPEEEREFVKEKLREHFEINEAKTTFIEKRNSTPFRMLGLTVIPDKDSGSKLFDLGRIRLPREKSDRYRAIFHQLATKLKNGVAPHEMKKLWGQANGIAGHLNNLSQAYKFEFRNRLKKRLEQFHKIRSANNN